MTTSLSETTLTLTSDQSQWGDFQHSFWNAEPYPHICIDNFLQKDLFKKVVNDFKLIDRSAVPTETYSSAIELNKDCFEASSSYANAQQVVNCLSSPDFLKPLESLLAIDGIIPLPKFRTENKSTRKYLHIMKDGGFLGSHVDQSHIDQNYIHILSCIFYASEQWSEGQGGHTTLFNKDGSQAITKIEYKPNRLAIFLHTSESFHGVSRLKTEHNRYSIYMDYYLPVEKLKEFKNGCASFTLKEPPKYWEHDVIFFATLKDSHYTRHYNQYLQDSQNKLMLLGKSNNQLVKFTKRTKSNLDKFKNKVIGKIKTLFPN